MAKHSFAACALLLLCACSAGQRADKNFNFEVDQPTYTSQQPVLCYDEGHNNHHKANKSYRTFTKLAELDGYEVEITREVNAETLSNCAVYAVVNASGSKRYKLFGINLPIEPKRPRHASAFSPTEVAAIKKWVDDGGALLLIADHYPFGAAANDLSSAFGARMSMGFTEATNVIPGQKDTGSLLYTRDNQLLGNHPILAGVDSVMTFTGQSVMPPAHAAVLLALPDSSINYIPPAPEFTETPAKGWAQGIALTSGKGRVVVLTEAAMLTAQIAGADDRFGMNFPGNQNQKFALNILHWLTETGFSFSAGE